MRRRHHLDRGPRILLSSIGGATRAAARLVAFVATPSHKLVSYVGWVGRFNLGDEALAQATKKYFYPDTVRYIPAFSNKLARELVAYKAPRIAMLGGGTLIGPDYWREVFKMRAQTASTRVVFGSGVLRDPSSGRPVGDMAEWKLLLRECQYVGVREEASANLLGEVGIGAEVLGDPACYFVLDDPPEFRDQRTLGVNFGATGDMWGTPDHVADVMARALITLRVRGWNFRFFVVCPEDLRPTLQLMNLAGLSDVSNIIRIYQSGSDFVRAVAGSTAFLAFKLHAGVLALCAHVPTLMLAYRPKGMDFMRSLGLEECAIRTDVVTPLWIVERVENSSDIVIERATDKMIEFRNLQRDRAQTIRELG